MTQDDMDVVGAWFSLRAVYGTDQVELYIEDPDEVFSLKATFSEGVLNDLAHVAITMKSLLRGEGVVINSNLKL